MAPPPPSAAKPPSTNSTAPPPSSPPPASPPPSAPPPASPPPSSPPPASPPPVVPPKSPPPSSPPPLSSPPPVSSPPPAPSGQSPPSGQPPPSGKLPPPKAPVLPPPGRSPPTGKPPPPPPPSSKSSVSTPLAVGIAVGSLSVLAILGIIWFCCFRKRRRDQHPPYDGYYDGYYGRPPGSDGNLHSGQPQNWQHIVPPPADDLVKIPPQPSPPPYARPPNPPAQFPFPPPPPPPPALNSSGASISNDSGSGGILLPPPSPGLSLGFSKILFTYEELALATDGFSNLIGQGGFGYVHKGTLPNGREVAVKQLKSESGQGEREFQAEVEIISRVHHKHLVSLVGYCISGDQRLLVYEYVPNRTLDFHLHGKDQPTMDWSTRLKIALGSAKGLAYLHEDCYPKIIHRDIKGSNILLDNDFEAKVADFGLAKFTSDNQTHISTRVMGSFGYIAPEYASSGKLTDKSDVYSFGIVLLELITGKVAYDPHRTSMDDSLIDWARPYLTQAVEDGNYDALVDPWLEKNYNPDEMLHMVACAAACVRYSARNRPRMSQIVRSLEGDLSLDDLNRGVKPGHSTVYGSSGSSYDLAKYNDAMKNFKKLALGSQEYGSSEYSAQTSEYGQNPSVSSSEGQQMHEMDRKKKDSQGFNSSSH